MKKLLIFTTLTTLLAGTITATVAAAYVSRGYYIANVSSVPVGALVSVKESGQGVELATTDNAGSLAGVVTESEGLVDVQSKGGNVTVASDGQVSLLASTLNGDISVGDKLVVSPIAGIATKTESESSSYVAISQSTLSAGSSNTKQTQVTLEDGSVKTVSVGSVTAQLTLNGGSSGTLHGAANALSSFAQKVVGKEVSLTKVLVASSLIFSTTIVTSIILYGAVKGTFISLGRNPLSRGVLLSAMTKSTAWAVMILSTGITVAYIILNS